MADLLQHPWIQIAAWALLHFVWQGAAIALCTLLALQLVRSANARYALGVAALALMALAPLATAVVIAESSGLGPIVALPSFEPPSSGSASAVEAVRSGATMQTASGNLQMSPQLLGFIVAGWLCGLLFFAIRLAGGWVVARRMARRAVEPATEEIQRLALALSRKLRVRHVVTVLQSSTIHVPVVIGWIAPTIVLPVAALSGLSGAQVEALLAHELAHIRRHDYFVNLVQSVLEVALFYHPAVWWLSRQVRAERERCCDDLAVGVCDRLVYASALGDLAALSPARVALAATDGDLLERVRRILSREEVVMSGRSRWSVVAVLGLATAMMVPVSMISAGPAPTEAQPPVLQEPQQPTAAQVEALKRLYDEMRARMADLEKLLAQTLGKATHDAQSHAERAEKMVAEQMKHADVAKHMDLMKLADHEKYAELAKSFDQMKHVEKAQRDELAKHLELMKHEQERVNQEAADHVRRLVAEQMKHADAFEAQRAVHAREIQEAARAVERQLMADQTRAVHDEKATVAAGDVVHVTIGGEPDLPSMYRVTTEGTIRLPFLGPLKVVGLTAAQVRDAVGRQLSDRRLGSAATVEVKLFRARK